MEAVRELEAAFQKEGILNFLCNSRLNVPPSLVPFIDEAAHGTTEEKARFAVYQAMAKQILHVEQVIPFQPNVVLVYPSALLEYIRKKFGGQNSGGFGKGKHLVSLRAVGSMEWRTSGH
ncbi:hypothetical protein RvY_04187 [Ramazzottius varieornatus]|uniref:Uncharacterized protein n=1 Tax=Ramazzottius varieornatus TaxID=947166 RepID=A0A1D1URF8_RAMVA|nr:hypothetical protein RvY_04187 [Ramazzottius varieornatus]